MCNKVRLTDLFKTLCLLIEPIRNVSAAWASISTVGWWREGGGARAVALALAAAAALAAVALALHSAHRTRAYQRAADKDSLTDSDGELRLVLFLILVRYFQSQTVKVLLSIGFVDLLYVFSINYCYVEMSWLTMMQNIM